MAFQYFLKVVMLILNIFAGKLKALTETAERLLMKYFASTISQAVLSVVPTFTWW